MRPKQRNRSHLPNASIGIVFWHDVVGWVAHAESMDLAKFPSTIYCMWKHGTERGGTKSTHARIASVKFSTSCWFGYGMNPCERWAEKIQRDTNANERHMEKVATFGPSCNGKAEDDMGTKTRIRAQRLFSRACMYDIEKQPACPQIFRSNTQHSDWGCTRQGHEI